MTESPNALGLLQLMRLTSPALPVGGFTGSEGLEYAVEAGWVCDESSALDWLGGRLRSSLSALEVPLLRRFQDAWRSGANEQLRGGGAKQRPPPPNRESAELWEQDSAMGRALARLLVSLDCGRAEPWTEHPDASYACSFALAADHWGIAPDSAAAGFVYGWCETQVAAAVKLVPLGQTAGQRLLGALIEDIPGCVREGLARADTEIGSSEPGLAIASALPATQHARLFRS